MLQQLDCISTDTVTFKAGPDKWSIVEAIEHLVIAEEDMLEQLTGAGSSANLDPQDRSTKNFQIVIKVIPDEDRAFDHFIKYRTDRPTRCELPAWEIRSCSKG